MADKYYITTAIAYPNGRPHIGHAYEAIAGDAIARFQRMLGKDVRFITGTDEHGLKMAQTARAAGRDTLEFATEMSNYFRDMCAKLNISIDEFSRTTEARHHAASIAIWKAMEASGDLYLDRYEGWYSIRDEAYYDASELVDGEGGQRLSPQGTPVEWTTEETWFFRLSKYRDFLIELNESPGFLEPESRRNEILSFLKGNDLRDLSVSRTSFDWGVPVPGSPGHVMYVWVDALTTYLTATGFPGDEAMFGRFWPADLHLIGKDITRFHTVYWPAFLKSAGLPIPGHVFSHGFLLHRGEKMSKSLGNTVEPLELAATFGVDQLRYFLLREVPFGNDGSYSPEAIVNRCNAELANSFGNLAQRTLSQIFKNCDGYLPEISNHTAEDQELFASVHEAVSKHIPESFAELQFSHGLEHWMGAIFNCNQYVDAQAPWALRKTDPARMQTVLATLYICIAQLAVAVIPVMPERAGKLLDAMGIDPELRTYSAIQEHWYSPLAENNFKLEQPSGVFPRLELPAEDAA